MAALSVTEEVPAEAGVPDISPFNAFTDNPAGSPPALKLVGPLVAAIWYENAVPTVPEAAAELVITGTGLPTFKLMEALLVLPNASVA